MRIVLSLGLRSLAAGWGTTVMLVLAVALGTAFQIPNTANLDGLHAALLEDGLAYGAGDIRIESRDRARFLDGTTRTLPALQAATRDLPVTAIIPSLVFPGAVRAVPRPGVSAPAKFFGAPVIGLDPDRGGRSISSRGRTCLASPPFARSSSGPPSRTACRSASVTPSSSACCMAVAPRSATPTRARSMSSCEGS